MRIDTPRKQRNGKVSVIVMPASGRKKMTRSLCSSIAPTGACAPLSSAAIRSGRESGSSRVLRLDPAGTGLLAA